MNPKHIKSKKSKSFSLIIVPKSSDVKQFNVSSWIPKLLIFLIIITISSSGYFIWDLYTSYNSLEFNYLSKSRRLNLLTTINLDQKEEIHNLESRLTEFDEILKKITELEETVIDLVGLEQNIKKSDANAAEESNMQAESLNNPLQVNIPSASRGDTSLLKRDALVLSSFMDRNEQINAISQKLEQSYNNLDTLIADVEKKLAYLEAKPNLKPAPGRIASPFGYRRDPFGRGREFHSGIDIANSSGVKIKAAGGGIVTYAGYNGGYGNFIIIKHGYGYESLYAHNRRLLVKRGDQVSKGDIIAEMGSTGRSTGPHLHFEVHFRGRAINPYNVLNNND